VRKAKTVSGKVAECLLGDWLPDQLRAPFSAAPTYHVDAQLFSSRAAI